MATRAAGSSKKLRPDLQFDAATFRGLAVDSNGSEPIVRHNRAAVDSSYHSGRKAKRETLRKALNDMERRMTSMVDRAMKRKVVLPVRKSDLARMKEEGKLPMSKAGGLKELAGRTTKLRAKDGPAVVVDLEGAVFFWYFPECIGQGLRQEILQAVGELAMVYLPKPDQEIKDRRAREEPATRSPTAERADRPATRAQTRAQTAQRAAIGDTLASHFSEQSSDGGRLQSEPEDAGEGAYDIDYCAPPSIEPRPYVEDGNDIRWEDTAEAPPPAASEHGAPALSLQRAVAYLSGLPPFAYYFTPGWYQTGMQYVSVGFVSPSLQPLILGQIRPMAMSVHFREALQDRSAPQTIRLLESKRLYDRTMSFLVDIIHRPLGESMGTVRECMSAVTGPTSVALRNGWTSCFPCVGIGVNRTSKLHRDSKGIKDGMDVIGVLGTFTSGGELSLPDILFEAEWKPGCVGAFDGYTLRHEVRPWEGGTRVALISFCRQSTWTGLKLDYSLETPKLPEVEARLKLAKDARAKAVQRLEDLRRQTQAAKRLEKEGNGAGCKADPATKRKFEYEEAPARSERSTRSS
ncbi:hypothetical protein FRC09_000712 [Ceratobasidium sp. 395]|nr:hypothetical protein FRC09_000712 [Ceratobasidium sp. 395]